MQRIVTPSQQSIVNRKSKMSIGGHLLAVGSTQSMQVCPSMTERRLEKPQMEVTFQKENSI
jgi:hypothetical protein